MPCTERRTITLTEECAETRQAIRSVRELLLEAARDGVVDDAELGRLLDGLEDAEIEAVEAETRASLADGAISVAMALLHTLQATPWTDRLYQGLRTDSHGLRPLLRSTGGAS